MILLDTNVLSALMKPSPVQSVVDWLDAKETTVLYLSTVTVAEVVFGLRIMPPGKRRTAMAAVFEEILAKGFSQRLLSFDESAARSYGEIVGRRRELGRPMGALDGQIAAIAHARRFAIATGNVKDFEDCGLRILNPFEPKKERDSAQGSADPDASRGRE